VEPGPNAPRPGARRSSLSRGSAPRRVDPPEFQQKMLAFIAGDFIYIGAGDLLPEAHRRFINWKVILSVIGGIAFMMILKQLVPIVGSR